MDIVPLGPGFAAEIRGVTLADVAADDAIYAAVRAAFEEHSVLVFRGQQVDGEGQLAFSRRFGPPEVTKVGSLGTGTNFVILTTIGPDGKVVPEDHRYAMRNKANQLWHTDSSFKTVPALTSVLAARTIPANGGETEFASTRLAFERLDPALQQQLENSFAWHSYGHSRGKIAEGLASAEEMATLPPVCWRMVWTNPVNGRKALYIASHTYAVEGMAPKAGEKLIEDLTAAATAPRHDLRAQMARRRRHHVGQPRHHASRPAVARQRAALHGAHHDLGDRGRRRRQRAPAAAARGGVMALWNKVRSERSSRRQHRPRHGR